MSFVGAEVRAGHVVELARARFGGQALTFTEVQADEDVIGVPPELLLELLGFFRDDRDLSLGLLIDLTCIDRYQAEETRSSDDRPPRFLVVYRLKSPRLGYRARVVVEVSEQDPALPSVTGLFAAADWLERELWDLFGIYPDGHPHLRRLLLYPGFIGHPLRRDYPIEKSQPLVPLRALPAPAVVPASGADVLPDDADDANDADGKRGDG